VRVMHVLTIALFFDNTSFEAKPSL
jgi:hypothetical protein